jgi:aspartate/methionine/tyrosine aminotransferase
MSQAFQPFDLERIMSDWEQEVEFNLSESGAHPMKLKELLAHDPDMLDRMLETELGYGWANGSPQLREAIAQYYPGATAENVLVTIGCIEANYITYQTLLQPGDEVAIQVPNYLQGWGIAQNMGAVRKTFSLNPDQQWALNIDEMNAAVTDQTKLIALCNPNNPTGQILTEGEMDAVLQAVDRSGAYLLADEIYAGAERETDDITPTFYGRHDRVISAGSMSKAYGLPGLRVGWLVGPADLISQIWTRHEYLTLSTAILSNHHLAPLALRPDVRDQIFARTRRYIRNGWTNYEPWLKENEDILSLVSPKASAISLVRYNLNMDSVTLVNRLIREKSVLIGPGDYFGVPKHIRISYGLPPDYLNPGLARIADLLRQVATEEASGAAAGS